MTFTYQEKVTLQLVECIACGVGYGVPKTLLEINRRDGGYVHCPNGHKQGWAKGSMQIELENAKAKIAMARNSLLIEVTKHDQTKAALADAERKRKVIEKRIANGVCPCCNRSFKNVHRHMETKHPEYV